MPFQHIKPAIKSPLNELDDTAEFEAGLTQHMPFLRAYAQSLSRNQDLAEDLAQATLAKAWNSRRSFALGSNLKAWLCTILRNEFISHSRRAWRQMPWETELVEELPAPAGEHHWAADLSDTARAMCDLPDTQRQALILVGVGGFSYEAAAALSKSAVGTIKSRVARARRALKDNLEGGRALPVKSWPASGNAMNALLAQLSQLSGFHGADARPSMGLRT
jgi:RNA polymerase sigma-70 factor (ECF subfamily)